MVVGVIDGNILYDYFIYVEWFFGGEILVSFNFFSVWECLEFFCICFERFVFVFVQW